MLKRVFPLVVAAAIFLLGLAIFAAQGEPQGDVYAKRATSPSVSLQDGFAVKGVPAFRVLVGESRKTAHWEPVNVVQYVGCSKGDAWTGTLCRKFTIGQVSGFKADPSTVAIAVLAGLMIVVPIVLLSGGSSTTTGGKKHG